MGRIIAFPIASAANAHRGIGGASEGRARRRSAIREDAGRRMRRQSAMRGAEVDRIRGMSGRGARAVTRGGGLGS